MNPLPRTCCSLRSLTARQLVPLHGRLRTNGHPPAFQQMILTQLACSLTTLQSTAACGPSFREVLKPCGSMQPVHFFKTSSRSTQPAIKLFEVSPSIASSYFLLRPCFVHVEAGGERRKRSAPGCANEPSRSAMGLLLPPALLPASLLQLRTRPMLFGRPSCAVRQILLRVGTSKKQYALLCNQMRSR
jgi:hypothetical protein